MFYWSFWYSFDNETVPGFQFSQSVESRIALMFSGPFSALKCIEIKRKHKCNFKLPFRLTCQTLAMCLALFKLPSNLLKPNPHCLKADPFIECSLNLSGKMQSITEFTLFLVN